MSMRHVHLFKTSTLIIHQFYHNHSPQGDVENEGCVTLEVNVSLNIFSVKIFF